MKRTIVSTLILLMILISSSARIYAQKGERKFHRGLEFIEMEQYYKAGMKFIKAYYRDYYPAFESLAYAAYAFNLQGYNIPAKMCFEIAEEEASSFASDYKLLYEDISFDADTIVFKDRESMYEALYTIADTVELWKAYELKDDIDILLYAAANIYSDELINDSAIYYANLGLKYNTDPDLYIIKGDCWLEEEQTDSALEAYRTAFELTPEDVFAICGIGEAYQQKKKYEIAMEYYEKAQNVENENLWVLYCKASLLNEIYEYSEAIDLYSRIIELNPAYYIAYFERAGIYFELDDYELAIADYRKYLEYQPGDEDALYNIDAVEENMWNMY